MPYSNDRIYDYLTDESCGKCVYVIYLHCAKYDIHPFRWGKGPFRCKECVNCNGKGPDWDTQDGADVRVALGFPPPQRNDVDGVANE